MSEMSCKTCGRWAAGWCLAQQLGTSRDEVCNAWELSWVVEWEDENEKLQSRIAELEAFVGKLIEVSEKMFTAVIAAADPYDEGMREWDKIVNDWKEG